MLKITDDVLPQSLLSYVAFRVALRETADRLCRDLLDESEPRPGYLAEVPFLKEVAFAVQLDLLAETWDRHVSRTTHVAGLLDESVLYAACEFAAGMAERQPERVTWCLRGGPLDLTVPVDDALATELRGLYLKLSNEGDFLLIGQLLDLPPNESREWKDKLGIDLARVEPLFDALSRWHASAGLVGNLHGLVSVSETHQLSKLLHVPCPA
ncbi:MAG: hypothetical protein SH850_29045 [Planctomycetaceae bacterium]|nr:hypothetical protein [Planctomycetaceae bacterium]